LDLLHVDAAAVEAEGSVAAGEGAVRHRGIVAPAEDTAYVLGSDQFLQLLEADGLLVLGAVGRVRQLARGADPPWTRLTIEASWAWLSIGMRRPRAISPATHHKLIFRDIRFLLKVHGETHVSHGYLRECRGSPMPSVLPTLGLHRVLGGVEGVGDFRLVRPWAS